MSAPLEDPPDGRGHPQVIFHGNEIVERLAQLRHDGSAAPYQDLEALLGVGALPAHLGDVSQVVKGRDYVIMIGAAREGSFELAREVLRQRMPHRIAHVGGQIGGNVEEFIGADAGLGRGNHVSHGVGAGLPRAQAHLAQNLHCLCAVLQHHVVQLDVLPGGNVTLLQRHVLLYDLSKAFQGFRGKHASWNLDTKHLRVGLTLTVDSLVQPESHKGGFLNLSRPEQLHLVTVFLHLLVEIGDDSVGQLGELLTVLVLFRLSPTRLLNQLPLLKTKCASSLQSVERRSPLASTFVLPYGGQVQRWKRSSGYLIPNSLFPH